MKTLLLFLLAVSSAHAKAPLSCHSLELHEHTGTFAEIDEEKAVVTLKTRTSSRKATTRKSPSSFATTIPVNPLEIS